MKTLRSSTLAAAILGAATLVPAALAAEDAATAATKGKLKPGKGKVNDRDCGQQIDYEAQAIDLNGDGQLEVITREYGSCFGMTGVQMNLYIKDKQGRWKPQFGFPGEPRLLKTKSHGFPDVEVQGPGQCFPVWRYNGREYQVVKRCR